MAQRNIEIVQTKIDIPTILVEHEGRMLPIHSKYNPIAEAKRFIDSYADEIEKSDHLLFYGVGLGYHIKVAQERYPEKAFSVYEPIEEVSDAFVNYAKATGVDINNLEKNYLEPSTAHIPANIQDFAVYFAHRILIITLPIYEKLVPEEIQLFNACYKEIMTKRVGDKQITKRYNERWLINSMMNIEYTFNTPNILMQQNNPFEGKPVILAAAGPSLSDEIENLKAIKEKGLAYIFAVGSANRALIKAGVMPDAVLSYDPQGSNWFVFRELIEENITSIPLIFGSTVGYETVAKFPGPKAYVIIANDTITPYLHDAEMVTVNDSGTISNVTFQILNKLNVGSVILVGQNFAFRDEVYYADGIDRYNKFTKEETDEKIHNYEKAYSFFVEDVNGNQVMTNQTLTSMRKEMEFYLNTLSNMQVINTTRDGAKIAGTTFEYLDEVMSNQLKECIVDDEWYEKLELPTATLNQERLAKIDRENKKFVELFDQIVEAVNELKVNAQSRNLNKLNKLLEKTSKLFNKLHANKVYELFVKPLVDVYMEQIYAEVVLSNKLTDPNKKADAIANVYLTQLSNIMEAYESFGYVLQQNVIVPFLNKDTMKFYSSTCGVFHYEGNWEKLWLDEIYNANAATDEEQDNDSDDEKKKEIHQSILENVLVKSSNVGDKISFKFKGNYLQLFGSVTGNEPLKVKLSIDGKSKAIELNDTVLSQNSRHNNFNELYKVEQLSNTMHEVLIEILTEDVEFVFAGIKIDVEGRAYHIHEVERMEDLEVGKRIRCHYEASAYNLGDFSGLGKESNSYLPVEPLLQPKGDFYFIVVDEIEDEKKLIADRNIQKEISFNVIVRKLAGNKDKNAFISKIRMINSKDTVYLEEDELIWNQERIYHLQVGSYSLVQDDEDSCKVWGKYSNRELNRWNEFAFIDIPVDVKLYHVGFRPILGF